jgi:hypothetical protein
MSQAVIDSFIASPALPTTPRAIAQSVGSGFVPTIYHPEGKSEATRFERLLRKAKATPEAALRHAERVIHFRMIRTNEAKRRLAAISDPWWVEVVASLAPKPFAIPSARVNRDRTGFDGWNC